MTIEELWKTSGAAAWGGCAYADLLPHMDEAAKARAEALCPSPAGVFAAAFPYFGGDTPGNLSVYARGEDYHGALTRRLEGVCAGLRTVFPEKNFIPLVDSSPLPERVCAALAGLGLRGRNTLTILPPWGSYLFLGTVLTDLPLETLQISTEFCTGCGNCLRVCPSGALSEQGLDREKCLSALTQRKGALTLEEREALARHPYAWGCDLCQRVCPYNAGVPLSPLPEFREALIPALSHRDVENLTNRQFQEKFPGRAFTWRGPGVLKRNLELQERGKAPGQPPRDGRKGEEPPIPPP